MIIQIQEYIKKGIKNPLVVLFVLLLFVEGGYKLLYRFGHPELRISSWFKFGLQLFCIFKILIADYKKLIPIAILGIIFLIGQLGFVPKELLIKNIGFLDRYIFILLIFIYTSTLKELDRYYPLLQKFFEVFIIFNSVLIILAVVFEIPFLRTYRGERFGYDGLIIRSGAASYIYWIALYYLTHQCIVLKKKKYASLILVCIASFLIGTKSIFIGYFFILLYFFIRENWYRKTWLTILLALSLVALLYFFKPLVEYASSLSTTFGCVYEDHGITGVMFSMRDIHLMDELLPFVQSNWSWRNYLFGGGYDMHWRSQFGVFDLLYFFGIIGTIVYFLIFWRLFVTFKLNLYSKVFIVGTFVMMAFAANFFYESIMAMHLVFIQGYLKGPNLSEK